MSIYLDTNNNEDELNHLGLPIRPPAWVSGVEHVDETTTPQEANPTVAQAQQEREPQVPQEFPQGIREDVAVEDAPQATEQGTEDAETENVDSDTREEEERVTEASDAPQTPLFTLADSPRADADIDRPFNGDDADFEEDQEYTQDATDEEAVDYKQVVEEENDLQK